ncbi:unnamed protein product [Amoebophrya sp. A25]|nr:unnamed protein product [Amoebophrya sp. A25]|eukprot:GSA25T00013716001.1
MKKMTKMNQPSWTSRGKKAHVVAWKETPKPKRKTAAASDKTSNYLARPTVEEGGKRKAPPKVGAPSTVEVRLEPTQRRARSFQAISVSSGYGQLIESAMAYRKSLLALPWTDSLRTRLWRTNDKNHNTFTAPSEAARASSHDSKDHFVSEKK